MSHSEAGRLEFRIRIDAKQRIEYAARLADVAVGDFVRSAAAERAEQVIRDHAATVVPADFFDSLMDSLDAPSPANPALRRAARRYRQHVQQL